MGRQNLRMRHGSQLNLPSPLSHEDSISMTINLHFGGVFVIVPTAEFVGGSVAKFDYKDSRFINLSNLDKLSEKAGINQERRYYIMMNGIFQLLFDDMELKKIASSYLDVREMDIYVDIVEAVVDTGDGGRQQNGNSSETEDSDFSMTDRYDPEGGDEDDDSLFDKNIDDVEEALFGENSRYAAELNVGGADRPNSDDDGSSGESDVVNMGGEMNEGRISDEEGNQGDQFPTFDPSNIYDPELKLGLLFSNKNEFRTAVQSLAIKTLRTIKFTKNDSRRVYAVCGFEGCPWKVHALKVKDECGFQIREFRDKHTCPPTFKVKNIKPKWLSERYVHKFKTDPNRKVKGFRWDVVDEIRCEVSNYQACRAQRRALKLLEGDTTYQYSRLWDYAEELRKTNPGSTIIVGTDEVGGEMRFDRFYACFEAMKKGFYAGCRPFIGVDGCHLKGPNGGILLTAIAVDPNNNLFPLAYAVVNAENRETWSWFLAVLKTDLNIMRDDQFTFMSDKQNELIQAFEEVFPNADHRYCVRHLLNNFKNAGFKGIAYENFLWKAAYATTTGDFKLRMLEMQNLDEKALDWFKDKPPGQWSRSHFREIPKCDMLLNNVCESFNECILEAREKHILTMLEWIREYLMKRMQTNRDRAQKKWKGKLCPKIQKILVENEQKVADCIPLKSNNRHYQISCLDHKQYCVDLELMTCTCRTWQLSGIPCKHAISAILNQNRRPEDYVMDCYTVETYKQVYQPTIYGIISDALWNDTNFIPPLPPNFGRKPGRPAKARRREADEPCMKRKNKKGGTSYRLKRQQVTVSCRTCGEPGHNSFSCPEKRNGPVHNSGKMTTTEGKNKRNRLPVRRKVKSAGGTVTNYGNIGIQGRMIRQEARKVKEKQVTNEGNIGIQGRMMTRQEARKVKEEQVTNEGNIGIQGRMMTRQEARKVKEEQVSNEGNIGIQGRMMRQEARKVKEKQPMRKFKAPRVTNKEKGGTSGASSTVV